MLFNIQWMWFQKLFILLWIVKRQEGTSTAQHIISTLNIIIIIRVKVKEWVCEYAQGEACNKCYEDIINDGNCSSLFSLECMKMKIKYIVAKCRKMNACLKLLHDIIQWKWNKATRWKTVLLFMSFNYDNNKPTQKIF